MVTDRPPPRMRELRLVDQIQTIILTLGEVKTVTYEIALGRWPKT